MLRAYRHVCEVSVGKLHGLELCTVSVPEKVKPLKAKEPVKVRRLLENPPFIKRNI